MKNKYGCSSDGRALVEHMRGTRNDTVDTRFDRPAIGGELRILGLVDLKQSPMMRMRDLNAREKSEIF